MNTNQNTSNVNRAAAVNGLAIVGFISLVGAGIWLAIYSAQYVPSAVSRLGAAAVSLSQVFTPNPSPSLSVVPEGATTTIPFGNGTTTQATSTTPVATTTQPTGGTGSHPVTTPTPGQETSGAYPLNGATTTAPTSGGLYGLPDLTVNITAVGYLATSSADSFVPATTVPAGSRPAVKFTIKNIGTNSTGSWNFSAQIPTATNYLYTSIPQQALNPGDSIDYTLGFDQANRGSNQTITIKANASNAVAESNQQNDTATATVTILGS